LTLHPSDGEKPLERAKSSMEHFSKSVFHARKTLYVYCWHLNNSDSAAMWSIYAGRGSGIAITSTYDSLEASFRPDARLFGGKVIYSDYSNDIIGRELSNNILSTAMRKRRSFDFERELRLVLWDDSPFKLPGGLEALANAKLPDGLEVACDLSTLINEIYVSPKSEGWFLELVRSVVETYGLNKEVRRSALDVHPMF